MLPETIGPYKVERELGRGGMGEVYLAHDARLDRRVAIKALPAHLAADEDRLARFQREAKVLASLSHPGIAAIYGLESVGGHQYLILEYVDGETLANRLARGKLPAEEALVVAKQIAEALEIAHERGVVHRDLKPGNVMLTRDGVVKVLDFGLARTEESSSSSAPVRLMADSPTVTSPVQLHSPTIPGVIMGTAGYMSPEQARGKPVDKRSDIFSFGCVLYEMLTGAMPFRGETVADAIGATLHKEPDVSLLPRETPRRVRDLLTVCLAKDRKQRLHDIGDARLEIERAIAQPLDGGEANAVLGPWWKTPRGLMAISLASAAVVAVAATVAWMTWSQSQSSREHRESGVASASKPVVRFTIEPPQGYSISAFITGGSGIAISPQGDRAVFMVEADNQIHLCVRHFAEGTARVIPNTEGYFGPFFSPDGKWLGFVSKGRLMKMPADGGPALTICEFGSANSFAWLDDGTIVWGSGVSGLWRVSADGGTPVQLAKLGKELKTNPPNLKVFGMDTPLAVPGADYVLACGWDGFTTEDYRLYAVSLSDGSVRLVMKTATEPRLIARDRLLFTRGTTVMSVGFDPVRGTTVGEPTVALEKVRTDQWMDSAYIGASISGTFASVPGGRFGADRKIVCVDETGKTTPLLEEVDCFQAVPAASPDGRKLVAMTLRQRPEMWVIDLERKSKTFIPLEGEAFAPRWSADGAWIYAATTSQGGDAGITKYAVGGASRTLLKGVPGLFANVECAIPDGSGLLLTTGLLDATTKPDLARYDFATESVTPLRSNPAGESGGAVSPNGKWIAYVSDESGSLQVHLGPLGAVGPNVQVSSRGGQSPRFSSDGKRLFFLNEEKQMMVSTIDFHENEAHVSVPKVLFDAKGDSTKPDLVSGFDVLPEGKFVMVQKSAWENEKPVIHVIMNWAEELRAKSGPAK